MKIQDFDKEAQGPHIQQVMDWDMLEIYVFIIFVAF